MITSMITKTDELTIPELLLTGAVIMYVLLVILSISISPTGDVLTDEEIDRYELYHTEALYAIEEGSHQTKTLFKGIYSWECGVHGISD